ncbi:hypothetical protein [Streptomyces triticisoli]|uniref:hypothetical protein n=1 Tax=Streptomyces triticisoli TaxID=2182797 RepID=UPI000DD6AED6|nr:hypothetical protein [Streptomyces triticisoli]
MRKYQRVAVVAAMLGSVSFLGAGVSQAGEDHGKIKLENKQHQMCSADKSGKHGFGLVDRNHIPVGALGLQHNDHSEHRSVVCTQLFNIGR